MSEDIVGVLHSGDYFGEIALLYNEPRKATCRAQGHVKVLKLDRDSFSRLLGPLHNILERNMDRYAQYEAKFADAVGSSMDSLNIGESMVEGSMVEEEESAPVEAPKFNRSRRKAVSAAPVEPDAAWKPRVVEKSDADKEKLRGIIASNVLFQYVDEDQRNIIINAMEKTSHKNGEEIIKQGDDGDLFYVLEAGSAEAWVKKEDGDSIMVLSYKPGMSFGELALLYGAPRAATVKATSDCECWALDRDTFRRILVSSAFKKQQQYEGFLDKVEILGELTKYEKFRIAEVLQPEQFTDGETILTEGDQGNTFYIIEEGTVVCSRKK
mmetsp:Transcript_37764/g.97432  ORF Transcript_37764/g.97432 Transcript_37764/m.97432 type:complete len:325 (-) Transcript_37764:1181-2155(-)|eukprot:CAMPEP_0113886216 /NCGR_PEP_ID=MMETSP0780_2-20120614/11411_1 /TAXON_ID=652834 /ORGANISM="Palpitomonas bilix" /LENGTH=324 /DNA_ID=CAMNT_0000874365 /DNA_START=69 /DNA_END=1043 /DNA_ORIENTATION=+ /assembly_acc=CAM_ASM_000599